MGRAGPEIGLSLPALEVLPEWIVGRRGMAAVAGERDSARCHHDDRERYMKPTTKGSIFGSLYAAARERRWNRDRSRRIAHMLERERATVAATADWLQAMAIQLAEIRALPEIVEPRR
jgi:hypothetical protein